MNLDSGVAVSPVSPDGVMAMVVMSSGVTEGVIELSVAAGLGVRSFTWLSSSLIAAPERIEKAAEV
jgi:hypothetical protein